jgi:hypothetical protein
VSGVRLSAITDSDRNAPKLALLDPCNIKLSATCSGR